jgi:AAA domain (Cdc48 subfamily)
MILLQILDEGSITDSQGRKVDFMVRPLIEFSYRYSLHHYLEHHHLPDE